MRLGGSGGWEPRALLLAVVSAFLLLVVAAGVETMQLSDFGWGLGSTGTVTSSK